MFNGELANDLQRRDAEHLSTSAMPCWTRKKRVGTVTLSATIRDLMYRAAYPLPGK